MKREINPRRLYNTIYREVRKVLANPMPEGAVCSIPTAKAKGGRYWVHLRGGSEGQWVNAASMTDAKWIFAKSIGVNSVSYIVASKKGPSY